MSGRSGSAAAAWTVGIVAVVLGALHQDLWFWDDRRFVLGMPIGLLYHALFSVAAACLWAFAVRFAWPHRVEAWAEEADGRDGPPSPDGGEREGAP